MSFRCCLTIDFLPQIIALHFALATPPGFEMFPIGPQFYMTCFNFKVTGDGKATPKGAKFPGAYDLASPGFHFNLSSSEPYPTVGPAVYKAAYDVRLEPKESVIVSPTNNGTDSDAAYYNMQYQVLSAQGAVTSYFESIGG